MMFDDGAAALSFSIKKSLVTWKVLYNLLYSRPKYSANSYLTDDLGGKETWRPTHFP